MKHSVISEDQIITKSELDVKLPNYITNFDDEHPILNIQKDEDTLLASGSRVDVSYIVSKYKFYFHYDYNLYLNSGIKEQMDKKLVPEYTFQEDIQYADDALSMLMWWGRKRDQHPLSIFGSVNNLKLDNIIDAIIYHVNKTYGPLRQDDGSDSANRDFYKTLTNLLHRVYYALTAWIDSTQDMIDDDTRRDILLISDILRPVANIKSTHNVFNDTNILRKVIRALYSMESKYAPYRSVLYTLLYIIDKKKETVPYNTSDLAFTPTVIKANDYYKKKTYDFKLGFFPSDMHCFQLTYAELVSLKTATLEYSELMQAIQKSLTTLSNDYLNVVNGKSGETNRDQIKKECIDGMLNVFGFEADDSWDRYFEQTIDKLRASNEISPTRTAPQDCYCQLLYEIFLRKSKAGSPYWFFDEELISELFNILRENSSDDQTALYEWFFKLNFIKGQCKEELNMWNDVTTSASSMSTVMAPTPSVDWSKVHIEPTTIESTISRVIAFLEPILTEQTPNNESGCLRFPTEEELKKYSNCICTKSEFIRRLKIVLSSQHIRDELMVNGPREFACGFNAKLLCNILGFLMTKDKGQKMNVPPLIASAKHIQDVLFLNRGVGTQSYKNYISRYDSYDGAKKTSHSILTDKMKGVLKGQFATPPKAGEK